MFNLFSISLLEQLFGKKLVTVLAEATGLTERTWRNRAAKGWEPSEAELKESRERAKDVFFVQLQNAGYSKEEANKIVARVPSWRDGVSLPTANLIFLFSPSFADGYDDAISVATEFDHLCLVISDAFRSKEISQVQSSLMAASKWLRGYCSGDSDTSNIAELENKIQSTSDLGELLKHGKNLGGEMMFHVLSCWDLNFCSEYFGGKLQAFPLFELVMPRFSPDIKMTPGPGQFLRNGNSDRVVGKRSVFKGRRKSGEIFPLELAVNQLVDDHGSTFIAVLRDLTLEHAARRSLEESRNAAERLAKVKTEFLANMSHEIRTPLSAILGFARIGMRENEGRASYTACEHVFRSGQHLLSIVNDILDFSKIEAGKMPIDPHPLQLSQIAGEAIELIAERAAHKGLRVGLDLAPDLPLTVRGDSLRIRQILVNLLSNAVKFTEAGSINLKVGRDAEFIYFTVRDDGVGMTAEEVGRLFQPFEQADGSTTRKYGGTGLGLSISQQLAQLMGGDISVVSTPGLGSSFTVRLPLPETAEGADEKRIASASESGRLAGVRVLVADDVEVNRLIIADMLEQESAVTAFAENGKEAVGMVEKSPHNYDIVLMDVQMPVMDGYDATRLISRLAPALPVIALTAHAFAEERDRSLQAGMIDHVTKPIDPDELAAVILRHVRSEPPAYLPLDPQLNAVCQSPGKSEIDWQALDTSFKGKKQLIEKVLNKASENYRGTPDKLRQLAEQGAIAEISFVAHSLKGLAGNLQAWVIHTLASETELAAKAGEERYRAMAEQLALRVEAMLADIDEQLREFEDD